ncbi:2-succinyl-5-enolpyruvyl-6-hydroxy-3-cyclohexene-1-carboxylic-acid synthase [Actinomyces graevenitzii]|uniref:2-succinyl-5-enolpyruvyl-6-hydroxy-3- cyclohexene-1-carboxylic-acid synthase n=1 Tax=Actinomyces graevenitzii TaxID=55565 RepID=UPI0004011A89|nr:2-succinyl-5-enolpyruvyl-6-hydroxy-3-cyclohexene-1-carboxylic-acid synthase [Actinomyces graevenitzii]
MTPQEASAPSGPAHPASQPPTCPASQPPARSTGQPAAHPAGPERPAASESSPGPESPATLLARAVVASLVEAGVKRVVISPGSRNAPLTYALADAAQAGYLQLRVVVDERSAAFVALGASRSDWLHEGLARPAVAVMTSGSAVANAHPAVVEADAAGVPLIILSADRPHALVNTGASQTTVQTGIFGAATRYQADLGDTSASGAVANQVRRAVAAASGRLSLDPGPVHLNVRLAPPLAPAAPWQVPYLEPKTQWLRTCKPLVEQLNEVTVSQVGYRLGLDPARRGVIVVGDNDDAQLAHYAAALAHAWGWPLLAEPTSLVRTNANAVAAYSALLAGGDGSASGDGAQLSQEIEQLLVVGHPTLTRPISALLAREDIYQVVLTSRARWSDVSGCAAYVTTLEQALSSLNIPGGGAGAGVSGDTGAGAGAGVGVGKNAPSPLWLQRWLQAGQQQLNATSVTKAARMALTTWQATSQYKTHSQSTAIHSDSLESSVTLMAASSMTIRYLDAGLPAGKQLKKMPGPVVANRGLAGIDGTISTAVGLAWASGQPVRVIIGDLAAAHDLTGLVKAVTENEVDLQVIVLDDHGGKIFSGLEYGASELSNYFLRFFTTAQQVDFAQAAAAFGAHVEVIDDVDGLQSLLSKPIAGRSLVHVKLV